MSDQHSQLDLLDALLAHEEAEMLGRTQHHLCDPEMRRICETRRRVYADVRSMIAALMSGERPGAGGFSRGANHFHENGELLPVPTEEEVLSSVAAQARGDVVSGVKFYAVQ